MDSLIRAAARVLAAGDPLGALNRVSTYACRDAINYDYIAHFYLGGAHN
ncbi:MAG: hypothetical protein QOH31_5266 [Verrucomicrobiota bacterium]|jgi:hypothetical protein